MEYQAGKPPAARVRLIRPAIPVEGEWHSDLTHKRGAYAQLRGRVVRVYLRTRKG